MFDSMIFRPMTAETWLLPGVDPDLREAQHLVTALVAHLVVELLEAIEVETNRGRVKMKARVDNRVAEGIVLVPHGWGGEANANLLTDVDCREPIMGYPDQKSLQCRIRKV